MFYPDNITPYFKNIVPFTKGTCNNRIWLKPLTQEKLLKGDYYG